MEQLPGGRDRQAIRLWLGAGLTVGFIALTAALIWAIDGLPVVNPFARWLLAAIAAPFWLLAPVVGGFAWRSLPAWHSWLATIAVGFGGVGVGAIAFWPWVGPALVCFGTVVDPTATFMPLRMAASVVFGSGVALMTLIVSGYARQGGRRRVVALSAGLQGGLFLVVAIVSLEVVQANVCRLAPAQP